MTARARRPESSAIPEKGGLQLLYMWQLLLLFHSLKVSRVAFNIQGKSHGGGLSPLWWYCLRCGENWCHRGHCTGIIVASVPQCGLMAKLPFIPSSITICARAVPCLMVVWQCGGLERYSNLRLC